MKLILKQPANKPPCICLCFLSTYEAAKLNKHYVELYKDLFFQLEFKLQGESLSLLIKQEEKNLRYRYAPLQFYPDKLMLYLQQTKNAERFNFCHVTAYYEQHMVAHTTGSQQLWVLKVNKVSFVREE